nr:ribonuclease H-like domain-containing protein [Tanacetum cinerariifolium]
MFYVLGSKANNSLRSTNVSIGVGSSSPKFVTPDVTQAIPPIDSFYTSKPNYLLKRFDCETSNTNPREKFKNKTPVQFNIDIPDFKPSDDDDDEDVHRYINPNVFPDIHDFEPSDEYIEDEYGYEERIQDISQAGIRFLHFPFMFPAIKQLAIKWWDEYGFVIHPEDMDQDSAHIMAASKVLMLKPDKFEIYMMRIEQYIQMMDYALWEVIGNGATLPKTQVVKGVTTVMPITSVEDKAQRRLKDAKKLLEAIEKRFGGNAATKKTQRNILKQQFENFSAPSSKMLDQSFDRLQKLVSQLELLGEKLSQKDVNQKLLRSLSPEWNTHVVVKRNKADLNTMSTDDLYNNLKVYEPKVKRITQVNAAFSTNIDNLSDAVICAFLDSQPNSPQLAHEDLQQIYPDDMYPDDMDEMDLRGQMAMLTMRARRHYVNGQEREEISINVFKSYHAREPQVVSSIDMDLPIIIAKTKVVIDSIIIIPCFCHLHYGCVNYLTFLNGSRDLSSINASPISLDSKLFSILPHIDPPNYVTIDKKGLPRIKGVLKSSWISKIMKSTGNVNLSIPTSTFLAIPLGCFTVLLANSTINSVGIKSPNPRFDMAYWIASIRRIEDMSVSTELEIFIKTYQPPQARNEYVNAISTRSGKSYDLPVKPNDQQNDSETHINFDIDDEDDEPTPQPKPKNPKLVKETPTSKPYKLKVPYPQRLRKEKLEAQYGKFLEMICVVRINVPLVDVLAGMPNYGKIFKELINNKHKMEQIFAAFLSDESSAIL